MNNPLYVQYGCGWCSPTMWRNFDASPTLWFERIPIAGRLYTKNSARFPENVEYGNISRGLPIPAESCEAVYCSHILEHLALEDLRAALRNTLSILKPGGTFRMVLPDFEHSVRLYLDNPDPDAVSAFMRETSLGTERRPRTLRHFLFSWLGNSNHLWMWDYKGLAAELQRAGFSNIRRATYGDSPDPAFRSVESFERWENCLGIECSKPQR